jgi:RNA polymerase sigma-70 factor (ECF subfamily)
MTCFERDESLREDNSFRAFVLGIARNILFRHYRDRYRKHDKIDFGVSSIVDLGVSPTSLIAEQQQGQRLLEALRGLAIEHQILLELYYWEGMQGRELAEVYGLPEGTVRTRLRRARQLLAQSFATAESGRGPVSPEAFEAWAKQLRERADES